jgi:hypothetical protein
VTPGLNLGPHACKLFALVVSPRLRLQQYFSMGIVVCNHAFFEDHRSILHIVPPLVVKPTCALQVFPMFSKLVYPTLDFDMGFL